MGKPKVLLYSFPTVKIWILGLLLLDGASAFAEPTTSKVLSFDSRFVQRQCAELFLPSKKQRPVEGALIVIEDRKPRFVEEDEFFSEVNTSRDYYFYNSSGLEPEFTKNEQGLWTPQLQLSLARQIYILRARRYFSFWDMDKPAKTQKTTALREDYRLISYTKLEVPPMFHILHKSIFFVRGVTSMWRGELYSPVTMNFQPVVEAGPLKDRLLEFLESWEVRNQTETDTKETLKNLIISHYNFNGRTFDTEVFAFQVAQELVPLFPAEFSSSLIDNL